MLIMSATFAKSAENRVQNIKKQFEVNEPPIVNEISEDLPRKVVNSTLYTEVKKKPKHPSPGIKRSPAFRCDKIVRGGGKTAATSNQSRHVSVVNKVKLFEESVPVIKQQIVNQNNGYAKPIIATKNISPTNFIGDSSNYMTPLDNEYKRFLTYRSHENLVNNECTHDNDLYHSHEDLTASFSKLGEQLPPGPPPRKPPRTFAHSIQMFEENVQESSKKSSPKVYTYSSAVKSSPTRITNGQKSSPNSIQNNKTNKPKEISPKPKILPQRKSTISNQNVIKSPIHSQNSKNSLKLKNTPPQKSPPKSLPVPNTKVKEISSKLNNSHINTPRNRPLSKSQTEKTRPDIKRPTEPPPCMPARSKTESQIDLRKRKPIPKPPNKPDLSAKALLTSCIPLNCASAHQYEPLPRRLSTKDISSPVVLPRSQSEEHIYAEPFNVDPNAGVPVKVMKTPIMLTSTGKQGLYYMSTPLDSTWTSRPSHLPLCPSFSSPALSPPMRGPPTPQTPPPKPSPKPSPGDQVKVFPRSSSPPQKPQRSALARIASGLAAKVAVQRATSPSDIDDTKIQVLMNQAFGALQLATPDVSTDSDSLDSPVEGGFVIIPPAQAAGQNGHPTTTTTKFYPSEEEEEVTEEEARKVVELRKGYIRRTSSVAFNTVQRQRLAHLAQRARAKLPAPPSLFKCLLLVGLNWDSERRIHVPYIKSKFPENADAPQGTELFVFPDCRDWPPSEEGGGTEMHRSYSLVLTDQAGERLYGYCRRVLPEGASTCIPLAYCVLTEHRASGFYFKVLAEVESRHGQPEVSRQSFLTQLHACSLPPPGQSLPMMGVNISRPPDPRLEERELAELFSSVNDALLIKLLSSMLLERKVLLVSRSLSKLTACVMALQSALYPFSWQHTFVPALPASMLEVCDAPTPFIIGLLKNKDGTVPPRVIDEGMVVDLDQSRLLQCMGDEDNIIPRRLRRAVRLALQLVASSTAPNETSRNVLVSEAFIRMFVEVCGHYRNHIVTQQDGRRVFERESFVKATTSNCQQLFLEWFTETAMFSVFIEARMQRNVEQGIFERRACEHLQEMEKSTLLFLKNYRTVNKKGKTFGDRIKDWSANL